MLRLDRLRSSRAAIAGTGIACLAAAFAAEPAAVRSQFAPPTTRTTLSSGAPSHPVADVPIARDPFEARAVVHLDTDGAAPADVQAVRSPPPLADSVPRIARLPANAGASALPFPGLAPAPPMPVIVRAVALGPHAVALVEERGRTRVIEPRDPFDGSVVRAVDEDGILLADGRRIAVLRNEQR